MGLAIYTPDVRVTPLQPDGLMFRVSSPGIYEAFAFTLPEWALLPADQRPAQYRRIGDMILAVREVIPLRTTSA